MVNTFEQSDRNQDDDGQRQNDFKDSTLHSDQVLEIFTQQFSQLDSWCSLFQHWFKLSTVFNIMLDCLKEFIRAFPTML